MGSPLREAGPGRLQILEGGGCLALFGLPFLGAGIFMLLVATGVIPISNADEVSAAAWPLLLLMGVAFTAVGGALVFGRSWTTLDATERTVAKEWGLLVPMKRREHRIEGYAAVRLGFERGDSDSADRYPIALQGTGGHLPLCSLTDFAEALGVAAGVARHLGLEVDDRTTDHPRRMAPDRMDLPLHARARRERDEHARVPRPPDARSIVTSEGDGVRIVIPVRPIHPLVMALMFAPLILPLLLLRPLLQFFRQTQTPEPVAWAFLGFLALFFVVIPAVTVTNGAVRSRRGRTIVTASRAGLRIDERGAWRTRTIASLTPDEILDVDYSTRASVLTSARLRAEEQLAQAGRSAADHPKAAARAERLVQALSRFGTGEGILVKTRTGVTSIGKGLDDEEVKYVHGVIRRALTGEPA